VDTSISQTCGHLHLSTCGHLHLSNTWTPPSFKHVDTSISQTCGHLPLSNMWTPPSLIFSPKSYLTNSEPAGPLLETTRNRLAKSIDIESGPGGSVGIATDYGLDGPGIESRWGARFFAHVQTGPGAHPASCTMSTGSFPGEKRPGRGADHPPPSSAEVENE
jgi:hypothetical protein